MIKKLLAVSIWAHDAIPADEWKYRNLKRVMFPMVDVFFFLGGLFAAQFGAPALSEFFPRWILDTFATLLSVSALVAFLGVAFPRLWPYEMVAKSLIFGLMIGYVVSLFMLATSDYHNRSFGLMIACIATAPVLWRLSLLGAEWQDRRVTTQHEQEALEHSPGGQHVD